MSQSTDMMDINYDLTQIRGVAFDVDGVLSPSTIPLHPSGEPMRMVNVKDGYALQLAAKHGLRLAIISGADTPALLKRYEGLGVQDIFLGVSLKLPVFERWMARHGLEAGQVAYVGDDIPDLPALRAAGLPVAPADAAPECRAQARYVSPCGGGCGVARDLLEQIMRARGVWMDNLHAFGW